MLTAVTVHARVVSVAASPRPIVPSADPGDNPCAQGKSHNRMLTGPHALASLPLQEVQVGLVQFSQVRGHGAQIEALRRLVTTGTPGHAYLFEGPEGVGKDMITQAFLARMACTRPVGDAACATCASCLAFARGDHPDIQRLEKDGASIRIDPVRNALKRLRYEPVVGAIKGLIIESADLLREEAANALLKTLEEPSGRTVFVLVTAKPQLLMETIRSRCQVLRFGPLSPRDVATVLVAEGQPADMAAAASALAEGSLTLGRTLCDPERMAFVDHVVAHALAMGQGPATEAGGFVDSLGPRLASIRAGDTEAKGKDLSRADLPWILEILRSAWRDALMAQNGVSVETLPHQRARLALMAMAERVDATRLMAAIDLTQRLEERLVLNPNPKLALTAMLVAAGMRMGSGK